MDNDGSEWLIVVSDGEYWRMMVKNSYLAVNHSGNWVTKDDDLVSTCFIF